MDRGELEDLDRETLVVKAQAAGIRRARILTRPELIDELLRLDPTTDEGQLRKSRGFFGKARDLVARVVERGLHLPDAADRIRTALGSQTTFPVPRTEPQAMPTVTLAEIYAAQGHSKRAIETLRRVLEREPEHAAARALLERLTDEQYVAPPPPLPPEPPGDEDSVTDDSFEADEANTVAFTGPIRTRAAERADEANTVAMTGRIGATKRAEIEDYADSDELTIDTGLAPGATSTIAGPSYDDGGGAEFFLDPASQPNPPHAPHPRTAHVPPVRPIEPAPSTEAAPVSDPAYAPTRELPRGAGRTYTFTASREEGVDVNANTDVHQLVPAFEEEAEGEGEGDGEPDECFAIPLPRTEQGGRTYVRWRVSPDVIGSLLGSRPRGRFVVRAHIVTPAWDGPNTETRDRVIDPDAEETILEALPEPSVVRVAIGWLDPARDPARPTFVPLAHSPALETARGRGLVIWTTKGTVPVGVDDPRAASITRALDAAHKSARLAQAQAPG